MEKGEEKAKKERRYKGGVGGVLYHGQSYLSCPKIPSPIPPPKSPKISLIGVWSFISRMQKGAGVNIMPMQRLLQIVVLVLATDK